MGLSPQWMVKPMKSKVARLFGPVVTARMSANPVALFECHQPGLVVP
jgi:hypothetical protein